MDERPKIRVRVAQPMPQAIAIRTGEIRLDAFLKLANAAESGGQAKLAIQDGKVRVNGEVCQQRGRKLRAGDAVRYSGQIFTVEQMKKNTSAEK